MSSIHLPLPFQLPGERIKGVIDEGAFPNSVLNRQQADAFIDLCIDESVLIKAIRRVRKNNAKGEVNKLDLATIVSEGASTTSKATTSTPSEAVMTYDMVKYRSALDIKTDFEEDNLEGPAIRDKIMGMFSKRISNDMELALIQGDEDLVTGDDQTRENNLFGVNDGLQKILLAEVASAQIIDCEGAAPSDKLYYDMKRAIPTRFRSGIRDYRFVAPCHAVDKWSYDWSQRETQGGDTALGTNNVPGPWGVPFLEIPLFPTDLVYGASSQFDDGSFIWLTPPSNLVYFVQREITIEWERKPRRDLWEATIHWRVDFEVDDPALVVIAKNVGSLGTASDYTGA